MESRKFSHTGKGPTIYGISIVINTTSIRYYYYYYSYYCQGIGLKAVCVSVCMCVCVIYFSQEPYEESLIVAIIQKMMLKSRDVT